MEDRFLQIPDVIHTRTGYCGGTTPNPTYEAVCSRATGHAEVVEVEYDPRVVGFEDLLEVLWNCHDPTKPVRPGGGGQYRSAIFYTTEAQAEAARQSAARLQTSGTLARVITTEIAPAPSFHPAEEYHQRYFAKARANCRLP